MATPPQQSEYEKAHATYRQMAKDALAGNKDAQQNKSKVMGEILQMEREAARAGTILSAEYARGDRIVVKQEEAPSKRSLQEEYIRKFDDQAKVSIPDRVGGEPKEQTLREFHKKRLLGSK